MWFIPISDHIHNVRNTFPLWILHLTDRGSCLYESTTGSKNADRKRDQDTLFAGYNLMNNLQAIHICLTHNILIEPERSIFITRENVIGLPYTHTSKVVHYHPSNH